MYPTPGYCVTTFPENIKLRVGSTFKDSGGKVVEVDKVIIHPDYHVDEVANDFAILKLKQPLQFSAEVQPIEIQCHCKEVPTGTLCNITGWGLTETRRFPADLRTTDIFTVDQVRSAV